MSGALHELLTMLALAGGGVGAAWLVGARAWQAQVSLGLLLAASWRWISLILMDAIGQRDWSFEVWIVPLLVALAVAVALGFRSRAFLGALSLAMAFAAVSVITTRVLLLGARAHSDSNWILVMSDAVQSGSADLSALGGRVAIKRGFAYPTLLALGPAGEQLTALTPYLWLVLLVSIWWLAQSAIGKVSRQAQRWLLFGLSVIGVTAALSAVLPWRVLLYVNGHTLFAIAAAVSMACTLAAIRRSEVAPHELVAVASGLATIAITRPEGIVFAAVLALPLLTQSWLPRWQIATIVASATGSLGLWLLAADWVLLQRIGLFNWLLVALLLAGSIALALPWFDSLRRNLTRVASGLAIAFTLTVAVWFNVELIPGLASLWQNLGPENQGLWGYFLLALIPITLLIGWKQTSESYRVLLTTSLLLIFATLASKVLDGAQVLEISLGRSGWTDSVNRMWIHSFGIFFVTVLVGMFERGKQLFGARAEISEAKDSVKT